MYLITASKFLKQKLKELRREMNLFTFNSKKFSTPFSIIDQASRKKISSAIDGLNIIRQFILIDI